MTEHPVNDLMGATMEKIKAMVDAFGGGSGAGVNVDPIAFLVVRGDNVRLLPVMPPPGGAIDRVVDMVPDLVDKVTDFVEKQQDKKDNPGF